jgi:hypothetical protein
MAKTRCSSFKATQAGSSDAINSIIVAADGWNSQTVRRRKYEINKCARLATMNLLLK